MRSFLVRELGIELGKSYVELIGRLGLISLLS